MEIIREENFGNRFRCAGAFAVLMLFPLSGCLKADDDTRCSQTECGPLEFRQGLLPLAVGNSWTFRDEGVVDSGGSVEMFTVTVTSWDSATLYESGGGPHRVWWGIGVTPPPDGSRMYPWFAPAYWRQGDSVYERQNAQGGGFVSALMYLVPPGNDTVTWSSTFGSDVGITISAVRLSESATVPAGTYDSCVAYSYGGASGLHTAVLCPGVGWVSFEEDGRRIRLASAIIRP